MIDLQDIQSLSEFQRNTKRHIRQLKQTGRPQVLTVNGRAEIIVQDAKSYQRMLDLIDEAEAIIGVRAGLESMKNNPGEQADQVFDRIRKKHHIPR